MRELEREPSLLPAGPRLAVVGRGRLGTALSRALREAGRDVAGPLGRGEPLPRDAEAVLLCVPDAALPTLAAGMDRGRLLGHCSGASRLTVLAPHEAFSLHPLMTVTSRGAAFAGAGAAVAGTTPEAEAFARGLATTLGMRPFSIPERDRARYHAAASMASNFLVTLEAAAEELAQTVGVERELLLPLVRATVENWAELGGRGALTGPVARGDLPTVAAQRAALAEGANHLLPLFEAMVTATAALAAVPARTAVG